MNSSVRNAVLWLIILCLVVLVWAVFKGTKTQGATPQFSELVRDVNDGRVESITINAATGDVHGKLKNGDEFHSDDNEGPRSSLPSHDLMFWSSERKNGAPEEIRTPSLLIRSQMLYPVELRAHGRGTRQARLPAKRGAP